MRHRNYSRRKFIQRLGGAAALMTASPVLAKAAAEEEGGMAVTCTGGAGQRDPIEIGNEAFLLRIGIKDSLNPYYLFDRKNKVLLADGDYHYGFGRPQRVEVEVRDLPDHGKEVACTGFTEDLKVTHRFVFPKGQDWFEEYMVLENIGDSTMDLSLRTSHLRHGFNSVMRPAVGEHALSVDWRLLAVPFLLNTASGVRQEYSIKEFMAGVPREMASEGWIITNGSSGILVNKYSQDQMEYAVVSNHLSGMGDTGDASPSRFLWGGAGLHHGDPEAALHFVPGQVLRLGLNRYSCFTGHWMQGFRLFRDFMDGKGHHFPQGFNPPVHWNEIYDNPHWWNAPDTPEKRARFYRLADMEVEAAKAAELGCEALYLDPGWDTVMGSTIWADDRLKPCREFCHYMKEKYRLHVSLHTPLAVWNKEEAYPASARKPGAVNGNYLCSGAPGWWGTKRDRLRKLASDGVAFFMFDGTNFTGPCEVKEHYHSIPYTREEHIRNYARLAQEVHKDFPGVLIEMHDQVIGPATERYVPLYYTHDATTFDSIWAFEYMWDPMSDLISGRSRSLYYYNLAYNIPLYDHINLKTDNAQALVFWWTASTCRHLGIGGKNGVKASPPSVEVELAHLGIGEKNGPPPEIWEAHKKAMKAYMRLKPFYVRGTFYGIDELTHVHTLREENNSVINCFNLDKKPVNKEMVCYLSDLGLGSASKWMVKGARSWRFANGAFHLNVEVPAMGVSLIEIISQDKHL